MYVSICMCVWVSIYTRTYTHMHAHAHQYAFLCVSIHIPAYVYCVYICVVFLFSSVVDCGLGGVVLGEGAFVFSLRAAETQLFCRSQTFSSDYITPPLPRHAPQSHPRQKQLTAPPVELEDSHRMLG
uniref:Uncharacterized protein n=1 Tax=Anguilla anguilla TaxID=7936 RepID=A0A0E9UQA3_ANGAN